MLLAVYHTVISIQNLTTNEHVPFFVGLPEIGRKSRVSSWQVKNYYREGQNPFDFGGHNLRDRLDTQSFRLL